MVRVRVRLVRVRVRVRVVGRVGAAHRRAPVALRAAELRRPRLREDVEVEVAGRVGRRALFAHAARRRTPRAAGRTAGGRHARAPIWDLRAPSGEAFPADENAEQTLRRHQGSIGEFTHNTTTTSRAAVSCRRSPSQPQPSPGRWRSLEPASACGQAGGAGARPSGLGAACQASDGFGRLLLPSTHSASLALPGRARKVLRTCTYDTHITCKSAAHTTWQQTEERSSWPCAVGVDG